MYAARVNLLQRLGQAFRPTASSPSSTSTQLGIRSPWTEGQLSQIAWSDVFGTETKIVTRADAMRIPAVSKARHTLVSAIANLPLVQLKDGELSAQSSWLYRTDGTVSPWHRMAWIVDDLLFYDWSLLATPRSADGSIQSAERVPIEWWYLDTDGQVVMTWNGTEVRPTADQVILIPGPGVCLLDNAATTIRAAADLERTWAGRARNPIPAMEIHVTTEDQLDEEDMKKIVLGYANSRNDPNGAIAVTPHNVTLIPHGSADGDMLEAARNAVRIDVANLTGLPGAALDGSLATASLTYVTQDGKMTELAGSIDLFADPIAFRLSQDDVVPRGQRVRFDKTNSFLPNPTGPEIGD